MLKRAWILVSTTWSLLWITVAALAPNLGKDGAQIVLFFIVAPWLVFPAVKFIRGS